MKPKVHGKLEYIPAVQLYREDLDALLSLFGTYCATVTISDADSEYESLDEMKQHVDSRVRTLEFVGTKPDITLAFLSQGSTLRNRSEGTALTPEEVDKAELVFSRVKEFLLKRKRLLARIFSIPGISLGCLAVVILAFILNARYPTPNSQVFILVTLVGIIPIVFIGAPVTTGSFRSITFDSKTTASSFWKRNRDDLFKLGIGSALGVGGTLLVQWISRLIK
jgi:amino acid transporter